MPRPYDFAVFANDVYNPVSGSLPDGWRPYIDSDQVGLIGGDNYFGKAYVNDALKQYIVAHRGTVLSRVAANLWEDLDIALGNELSAFQRNALPFVRYIMANMSSTDYSFAGITGHSLGAAYSVLSWNALKSGGVSIPTTVFELPMPSINSPISAEIQIYNAAPNGINTVGAIDATITRLYPQLNLDQAYIYDLPPSLLIDYAAYTRQQHGMSELLAQFNTTTGNPLIYSLESNWPGSGSYTGYYNFISYGQNPYLLRAVLYSDWLSNPTASLRDYLSEKVPSLTSFFVPKTGKTIVGDDSGNNFWGGTEYNDTYLGGAGNDIYWLFGGDDTVIDTGGANSYYFVSPQSGKKTIFDANPKLARAFNDSSPIEGKAIPITKYAPPISGRSLTEGHGHLRGSLESHGRELQSEASVYALFDPLYGRAFIAQNVVDGSLRISDSLSHITTGEGLAIQNFTWGDFGITQTQQLISNITIGSSSLYNISGLIPNPTASNLPFPPGVSSVVIGTDLLAVVYSYGLSTTKQNGGIILSYSNGTSRSITPTLFNSGYPMGISPYISTSEGKFITCIWEQSPFVTNLYQFIIFSNNGSQICASNIATRNLKGYDSSLSTAADGNFLFAATTETQNTITLYTLSSTNCFIISSNLLLQVQSGTTLMPIITGTNGDLFFLVTSEATRSTASSKIYFFNASDLTSLSQYNLTNGYVSDCEGRVSTSGTVAIKYCLSGGYEAGCYLTVVTREGIQAQTTLYYSTSPNFKYLVSSPISWLDNDIFAIVNPAYNSLTLTIYDEELNVLNDTSFAEVNAAAAALVNGFPVLVLDNKIFAFWQESPYQTNQNQIAAAVFPFSTQTKSSTDVILGGAAASDIDCSTSTAPKCYAIAQSDEQDILTARKGQNAVLIGSPGSDIFKFLPASYARLLSAGEENEPSSDVRNLQTSGSNNNSTQLWSFDAEDSLDLSAIDWQNAVITTSNGTSWLSLPGVDPIQIIHAQGSIPFNLTMSAGGMVTPVSPYLPVPTPSNTPISPSEASHASGDLGGGAIAGIVISIIALIGVGVGIFIFYDKIKNWWHSDKVAVGGCSSNSDNSKEIVSAVNPLNNIELTVVPNHEQDTHEIGGAVAMPVEKFE